MHNPSLLKEIEQCREEMIALCSLYSMTSDVVIQSSVRLDDLLNQYTDRVVMFH